MTEDGKIWLTYLAAERPLVVKALEIARQLDAWAENITGYIKPLAGVAIYFGQLVLDFGPVCVWNSEEHDEEELTFERCQQRYKEELQDYLSIS